METDRHVEIVPKLSTIAADLIAKFPSTIAETGILAGSRFLGSSTYRLRRDYAAVSLPVSESLLDAFRRHHIRRNACFLTPKILGFFFDPVRTPLFNLNLEGSSVDDLTLVQLIAGHGRNLLYINFRECVELTDVINEEIAVYEKDGPVLRNLRVLNLGNLVKLFSPWLRVNDSDDEDEDLDEDDPAWRSVDAVSKTDLSMSQDANSDFDAMEIEEFVGEEQNGDHFERGKKISLDVATDFEEESGLAASSSSTSDQFGEEEEDPPSSSSPQNLADGGHKLLERSSTITLSTPPLTKRRKDGTFSVKDFILTSSCPNLLALILHGDQLDDFFPEVTANVVAEFFLSLLHHTRQLLYLDLSYWSKMSDLRFLRPLRCIQTLILFEVPDLYQAVNVICSLTTLRNLDLSQSDHGTGQYPHPVTTLDRIIRSLPHLTSLDITSTNLASNPTKGDFIKQKHNFVESDIVGLRSLRKPLEYLGVFYCDIAAHYHRIPAEKVSGDANENQILVAIQQYMKRPSVLLKVLNEAYQIYRFGAPSHYAAALHLMLEAMNSHVKDANIQIASSASIFYIARNVSMVAATKKRVVNALLTGLEEHIAEPTMVRNCCLSLCQFEIPHDLLFDYTRAARLLLRVLDEFQDQMTQRIVVYLLNSMACHVEGEQKVAVGELSAVERILTVIRHRHEAGVCDEVMEVSWSFLWNITDETPANCERFLRSGGMQLFYECYTKFTAKRKLLRNMTGLLKFPDKNELMRNMMGLMGNIAEVKEMRTHLMKDEYVAVFCELLKNLTDGIEISYNSAGVLSHMLSDSPTIWRSLNPSRDAATRAVIAAIETWQINARRFINYRSFEPILRLVPLCSCPASQYWSIWALANLTTVDGNKYCPYVFCEGGVPLLEQVTIDSDSISVVRQLAKSVLENVKSWASEKNVDLRAAKSPSSRRKYACDS